MTLCPGGNLKSELLFKLFDWDGEGNTPDNMGEVTISMEQVLGKYNVAFPIKKSKDGC